MANKPRRPVEVSCRVCGAKSMRLRKGSDQICAPCKHAEYATNHGSSVHPTGSHIASSAINHAVANGFMKPPTEYECVDCGVPATSYDHRDYAKPLDVQPVCTSCNLKRGPAIPLEGSIEILIERGHSPYRHKGTAKKLFTALGLDTSVLDAYPGYLENEDWAEFWPIVKKAA